MNLVIEWNHLALMAIRALGALPATDPDRGRGGPPQVARTLGLLHTAAYDAWSAYNAVAKPVHGTPAKRPVVEHANVALKSIAISEAYYCVLKDQFPFKDVQSDKVGAVKDYLCELQAVYTKHVGGLSPSTALTDAKRVGGMAASLVLSERQTDGANEAGRYADPGPTFYRPRNRPMPVALPTSADAIDDPSAWQALSYLDGEHILRTPGFIAPHWGRVKPFALASGQEFRPATGPHQWLSQAYLDQARYVIDVQARLTTRQKVIAEYWADGPNSSLPPGHWTEFASFVAQRDYTPKPFLPDMEGQRGHELDQSVKLFFALANAVFDASIAVWDTKRHYDSARPVTAIRHLFRGQTVQAWAGPGQGTRDIPGETWQPFQKASFPTPPFAEFVSGHSGFSMAAATVLRQFTGSDAFGFFFTQDKPLAADPSEPVQGLTLSWPTFTAAAREAGDSRIYGGIHFYEGNVVGLDMGRKVGDKAFAKAKAHWEGTA
jgi:hypothetical protein